MTTPAPLTPEQLARIRETIRPTIEDWARDCGIQPGKEHRQLENRIVAAIAAMQQSGVIEFRQAALEGPR